MKPYYEDGSVTIYHGDCFEFLTDDPPGEIGFSDLLITDPPYGIEYASGQTGKFRGVGIKGDADCSARDTALAWWGNGAAAVFGTWKRPRPIHTRHVLIWDKGEGVGMGDLAFPWRPNYEEVYILGDGWAGHRGSSVIRDTSVVSWTGDGRGPRRLHPTEKPVPLLRGLIAKAPDANAILDPFMGSGTTLRAAKDLGRKAIGIEIEERYCEIAAKRCAQEVLAV